jgi:glycosyltransferase involved in cell wall biosynthesis
VSIVTPTYQRAGLLRHTIDSIRRQTYPNIEHIVVDGGSTDGTVELLQALEGTYPLRWVSERDEGMYHAINKGLGMARGEVMAYLNSDDLYFPWTVRTVVDAFARRPDADFVFGDALNVDDATGEIEFYWMLPFDLDWLRRYLFIAQPTVFWRRRAFEQVGPFDTSLRYVADCDYWMRAGATHRFVKVDEFLAIERDHAGTLRESVADQVWPEVDLVRRRYVRLEGRRHRLLLSRHRMRSRLYHRLYWAAFLVQSSLPERRRTSAWRHLLSSGHIDVDRRGLLVRMVPRIGPRIVHQVIGPSRYWLEPGTDAGP